MPSLFKLLSCWFDGCQKVLSWPEVFSHQAPGGVFSTYPGAVWLNPTFAKPTEVHEQFDSPSIRSLVSLLLLFSQSGCVVIVTEDGCWGSQLTEVAHVHMVCMVCSSCIYMSPRVAPKLNIAIKKNGNGKSPTWKNLLNMVKRFWHYRAWYCKASRKDFFLHFGLQSCNLEDVLALV